MEAAKKSDASGWIVSEMLFGCKEIDVCEMELFVRVSQHLE